MRIRTSLRVEETPRILRRKAASGRRARGTRRLTPFLNGLEERRLLSGDVWTQRGGDAGHAAYVDVSVAPGAIAEAWTQPLTYSSTGSWAQHGNRGVAIDATHVYRTDLDGYWASGNYHIIAYDLQTGAVDWNQTIVGNGPVSAPSVANGVVYVNRSGHSGISGGTAADLPRLYGLSAETGATVVQTTYAAQWQSDDRPTIADDQLIAWDGYYGGFSAWTASTLTKQWNTTGSIYDPPQATLDGQYVYAYGNKVYQRSTGEALGAIVHPMDSTPTDAMVSDSGKVMFEVSGTVDGVLKYGVAAYEGATHSLLWTAETDAMPGGKAVGNGVVAITAGTQLVVLDESTGARLGAWQAPAGQSMTPEIVLTRTHVFVETMTSYPYSAHVYAVNLATGQADWSFVNTDRGDSSSGSTYMDMAFAGGHLVLSHDSFVRAFSVPETPSNGTPVAVDDAPTTAEDGVLSIDVLANDSDPDGDPLAVAAVGAAAHGSVVLNADQSITYAPAADYNGPDSFTYTISDGRGGLASATVRLTVTPVNDPPVVAPAAFSLPENAAAGAVVGRIAARDVDGDALTFSLDGNGAEAFAIDPGTGVITVADPALHDFETQRGFDLMVHVSDGVGGVVAAEARIDLTDVLEVAIDVLPADPDNLVSLSSKEIEVAILASTTFNPQAMLDLGSLQLRADGSSAGAGVAYRPKSGYRYEIRDVNGDGILDLVVKFKTSETGLRVGDHSVRLEGSLLPKYGGESFVTEQEITLVGGVNGPGKGNRKSR